MKKQDIAKFLKWSVQPESLVLWTATANLGFNLFQALTFSGTGVAEAWYIRWDPMNLPTSLWVAAVALRIGGIISLCISALIAGVVFVYWTYEYIWFFSVGDLSMKVAVLFKLFDAFLHLMQVILAAIILLLSVLALRKQIRSKMRNRGI